MPKDTISSRGFGLVETAVIMIIVGVIMTTVLTKITSTIQTNKVKQSRNAIYQVRDEVIGFCVSQSPPRLPTQTEFNNMALPQDPWGGDWVYIVANDDTGRALNNDTPGAMDIDDVSATDLSVRMSGSLKDNNVAFAIVSKGTNTTQDAVVTTVAPDRFLDLYPQGTDHDSNPSTSNYDDLSAYVLLSYLKGKINTAQANTTPTPPGTPVATVNFDDGTGYTSQGGAQTVTAASAGGGIGNVLSLDETTSGYVSLDDVDEYRLHQSTIMGWFKTTGTSVTDYEPLVNRQRTGEYRDRTWWITLWSTAGTDHADGELMYRTSGYTAPYNDINFDLDTSAETRNTLNGGTLNPTYHHHDGQWHFFAGVMTDDCTPDTDCSAGNYENRRLNQHTLTLYVTEGNTCDWATDAHNATVTRPDGPELESLPASWPVYIGREVGSTTRYFSGYVDEISIYDNPLSEGEIEQYYEDTCSYFQ